MTQRERREKRKAHREELTRNERTGWEHDKHVIREGDIFHLSPKLAGMLKYAGIGIILAGLAIFLISLVV